MKTLELTPKQDLLVADLVAPGERTPALRAGASVADGVVVYQPLDLIEDNRYQKRVADDGLAENIRTYGLKQYPVGRWHPQKPGVIELGDGHRRKAGFRKLWTEAHARPDGDDPALWALMPVIVQDLTDKQLFELCILANEQRLALSAIERAITLRDYMKQFRVSQAAAGKLFTTERGGPLSQGAVSHLTSLLDLPNRIQELVATRELPEVPARALVRIADWRGDLAIQIAEQAVSGMDLSKRAAHVDTLIDEALRRNAPNLLDETLRPWPLAWPGTPIKVSQALLLSPTTFDGTHQTRPAEVPACTDCPFHLVRHQNHYCLRQACFETKLTLWAEHEVAHVAERLEITAAASGESTTIIFPTGGHYDYTAMKNAQALVSAKLPELRIVARPRNEHGYTSNSYGLGDVFGSQGVALATVNVGAVSVFLAKAGGPTPARKLVPQKTKNESPAQAERRKVAEKELAEERALTRIAFNRTRADILWLVQHTAELIAERTVAAGGMLVFAIHENRGSYFSVIDDCNEATQALARRAGIDRLNMSYGMDNSGKLGRESTPELDQLRRQYLAYRKLTREVAGNKNATAVYASLPAVRKTCEAVATNTFGIELPASWDQPPVHHSPINCWTCGRFSASGSGKLTQGDIKAGWVAVHTKSSDDNSALLGVYCPEHARDGAAGALNARFKVKAAVDDAAFDAAAAKVRPPVKAPEPAVAKPINGVLYDSIIGLTMKDAKDSVLRADLATLYAVQKTLKHKSVDGGRTRLGLVERQIRALEQKAAALPKTNAPAARGAAHALPQAASKKNVRRHTQPAQKPSKTKRVVGKKAPKQTRFARKGK